MIKRVFLTPDEKSIFSDDERKEIIQVMRDVGAGKISAEQASIYCEMIYKAVKGKSKPFKCAKCDDTGLIKISKLEGSLNSFKCGCK